VDVFWDTVLLEQVVSQTKIRQHHWSKSSHHDTKLQHVAMAKQNSANDRLQRN